MKTNFKFLTTLLLALVVLVSCVQDDDFDVPNTAPQDVTLDGPVVSLTSVQGAFLQAQDQFNGMPDYDEDNFEIFTYDDEDDSTSTYVEAYVISTDEGGNFFEEIILQDAPVNPTVGIRFRIDVNPLFTSYEVGRKVFIRLDGLSVGLDSGVLTLGVRDGDRIGQVAPALQEETIIRSTELAEIVPVEVTLEELNGGANGEAQAQNEFLNLYVRVLDVQFNRSIVDNPDNPSDDNEATTYASEGSDQFDGERLLESCAGSASIVFSTSTFADFKGLTLPAGRGNIDGIVSLNFFGEDLNLVVNSPENVNLDSPDRCDPEFVQCDGASGGGAVFFSEDFEATSIAQLESEGWTNQNVSGGSTEYVIGSFSGDSYAQISGFNSGEDEIDVYLVTPTINMDATTGEELLFDIQANFDNGNILSVLVSTDFTGDASTATWTELDANIPTGPSGGFGSFEAVGPINVSCIDGNVNFAFFYQGSDPSATTRYHINNIEVTGN